MSSWPGNVTSTGTAYMGCGLRDTRSTATPKRGRDSRPMTRALTEKLALSLLACNGIAAIWQLHMTAADAHHAGYPCAANAILEIAEAAEAAWLRAEGVRALTRT